MTDDYLDFWGMNKAPFALTPDPDMLYLSTQHSECLMRLKYAIFSQKGGALLVSDNAGNGKTSILEKLKVDLNEYYAGRVRVVFINHPTLSPVEMIAEIAHQLGSELHTTEKIRALNYLRDRLFLFYNENIKVVVIVDEGQMLKERPDILGELRILLNFCVSDAFLLTFIFSGQKPLDSVLRDMPEFWQRLPVRFFLKNLNYNDTSALIDYRLEKAGVTTKIFTSDAYEGIYKYSEGCPRVICSIADLCLIIGYSKGVKRIRFAEVSSACRDMDSSGDGFHYYAYIKSRDQHYQLKPGQQAAPSSIPHPEKTTGNGAPLTSPSGSPPEASKTIPKPIPLGGPSKGSSDHTYPPSPTKAANEPNQYSASDSMTCQNCGEINPKDEKFCTSCNKTLYIKCPNCRELIDAVLDDCSKCHLNIAAAVRRSADKVKVHLKKYDILYEGTSLWLREKGIQLAEGERLLLIIPRGNIITAGPVVRLSKVGRKPSKQLCDFVLTDSKLMIGVGDEIFQSNLQNIDSCVVSNTGKVMKRSQLLIGFDGSIFRVSLPYNTRNNNEIFDYVSGYAQKLMLT